MKETAFFGAGCFWGSESMFKKIPGVSTEVGFMGGKPKNPSYTQVCAGNTGHAEVVKVVFYPSKTKYKKLLEVFWNSHDPTTPNRQGTDVGDQYRSVIFFTNIRQKTAALASMKAIEKSRKFKNKVVTQIVKASDFYKAEDYHQNYYEKHSFMAWLANKMVNIPLT